MNKSSPGKQAARSSPSTPLGKKPYQKPQLTNMGSVAKLTQGFTGSAADFMGMFTKMM